MPMYSAMLLPYALGKTDMLFFILIKLSCEMSLALDCIKIHILKYLGKTIFSFYIEKREL